MPRGPTKYLLSLFTAGVLYFVSPLYADTVYVGPHGGQGAAGTRKQPLATLQGGIDRCGPGDQCVVLTGTYREAVRLSKSGLPGKPIVIRAEGIATLDGTEPLVGPWEKWHDNIVRTKLLGPAVQQAFSNGKPLSPARWPNAGFEDTWIRSRWAASGEGSKKDLMICDALAATGIDFTGAVAVLNVGHQYKTWTRKILTHGKGKRSFTYALAERLGDGKDDGKQWWNDRFYITGSIKALDAVGEFYHDTDAGYFYLVTAAGESPEAETIAVKRRDFGMNGAGISDVHVRGFRFFGCTVQLRDAHRAVIEQCDIRFPSSVTMIGETMPAGKRFKTPATAVYGSDNTLQGLYVAYACGSGIVAAGSNNHVEDCIVHDASWFGTIEHAGISITPYQQQRTHSTISHCTVYNVGNIGIRYYGGPNIVEYNDVHHTGLACHDIAAIHTGSPAAAGSIARYNWVHHSMGLAMRGDDQTRELTVHHNLVWNCDQGIIVKGDRNKVYHNTILGSDNHGRLTIPTRQEPKKWWTRHDILPVQNANSQFFNNYCEAVTYRYQPLPKSPGISHNVTYEGKMPYADVLVNVDAAALEAGHPDARPRNNSPLIDQGKVVAGLTDGYVGAAPDVGAYEYGKPPWRAGAQRAAPSDIVLPIDAEVARSWQLQQSGKPSIPLPGQLAKSELSDLAKKKLQSLYDQCWTPDEIERRRLAIQRRGEPDAPEYAQYHEIVKRLHRQAYQRLVDRAATVLSASELKQFRAVVNPSKKPPKR